MSSSLVHLSANFFQIVMMQLRCTKFFHLATALWMTCGQKYIPVIDWFNGPGTLRDQRVAYTRTLLTASAVSFMSVSDNVGWTRNMSDVFPSSMATGRRCKGRIPSGKAFSK